MHVVTVFGVIEHRVAHNLDPYAAAILLEPLKDGRVTGPGLRPRFEGIYNPLALFWCDEFYEVLGDDLFRFVAVMAEPGAHVAHDSIGGHRVDDVVRMLDDQPEVFSLSRRAASVCARSVVSRPSASRARANSRSSLSSSASLDYQPLAQAADSRFLVCESVRLIQGCFAVFVHRGGSHKA